jgi:hypothetical protein
MEKLVYLLWKPGTIESQGFATSLRALAAALQAQGASQLRMAFADEDVMPAHKLRIVSAGHQGQPPEALISFWLDSAQRRAPLESLLQSCCAHHSGYLVSESEPLVNTAHRAKPGERTPGMNQVVLLRRPARLAREQWLDVWLNSHTHIAIETQSTFGYRQNIVVHALTPDALPLDAIVEENFPPEAMASGHAFYNAIGNDVLYKANQKKMFASVQRFIDFNQLDCLPMSEYNF